MKFKIKKNKLKFRIKKSNAVELDPLVELAKQIHPGERDKRIIALFDGLQITNPVGYLQAYQDKKSKTKSEISLENMIRNYHDILFPLLPYPENATLDMIDIFNQYAFLMKGYMMCQHNVPDSVLKNFRAAAAFDKTKFTSSMQRLLNIDMYRKDDAKDENKKEESMAKKVIKKVIAKAAKAAIKKETGVDVDVEKVVGVAKKVIKKVAKDVAAVKGKAKPSKEKKVTVSQSYYDIFKSQLKNKLTDKQIAKEMKKRHPDKKAYTAADAATVRGLYNRGQLLKDVPAPKVPVKAY